LKSQQALFKGNIFLFQDEVISQGLLDIAIENLLLGLCEKRRGEKEGQ
jgi:hypothetical protein